MKEKEMKTSLENMDKRKKPYSSPTIEEIGALKDMTRGGSGLNVDGASLSAQAGGPPSTP